MSNPVNPFVVAGYMLLWFVLATVGVMQIYPSPSATSGLSYTMFHVVYTLPILAMLAFFLSSRKEMTADEQNRRSSLLTVSGILCVVAFIYTTPWDNYLVKNEVWWYYPDRVLGTVGYVPYEEYSYFIIETVMACLWSIIVLEWLSGAPSTQEQKMVALLYLDVEKNSSENQAGGFVTQAIYSAAVAVGAALLYGGYQHGFYMGLILAWAAPVCLFQAVVGGHMLAGNKFTMALLVGVPFVYLCLTDCLAINQLTWNISPAHTLGLELLKLPLEEATFFFVTCLMCSQGLLLFDRIATFARINPVLSGLSTSMRIWRSVQCALGVIYLSTPKELDGEAAEGEDKETDGKKVVVIGAGFAGLATACSLAKEGFNVTVLERHNQTGGRARRWDTPEGFKFDLGPSWYWMPEVFEEFFQHFGKSHKDYYALEKLDPAYRIFFGEGDREDGEEEGPATSAAVDIPDKMEDLEQLFETIEPGTTPKLKQFMKEAAYKYKVGMEDFVFRPSISLWEYCDPTLLIESFRLSMFTSHADHVRSYFNHQRLRTIMEWPVLFLGSAPESTPAMYSMMNHAAIVGGTWYPEGGMRAPIAGMEALARELGVDFKCGAEYEAIEIDCIEGKDAGRVKIGGVSTNAGQFKADYVVGCADYHHVEQHLLPAHLRTYTEEHWDKMVMSPSSLLFYLGFNRKLPRDKLRHHNLFFDESLGVHATEIYDQPKWPSKPLFYASVPSFTDDECAPEGGELMFVLIPLAADLNDGDAFREKYFKVVMQRLANFTGLDHDELINDLVIKRSYAMTDFENDYHAYKGNAYGLANTLMQTGPLKPRLKSYKVDGLYYAGQLSCPGPGMPPSIISGRVCAQLINDEHKQRNSYNPLKVIANAGLALASSSLMLGVLLFSLLVPAVSAQDVAVATTHAATHAVEGSSMVLPWLVAGASTALAGIVVAKKTLSSPSSPQPADKVIDQLKKLCPDWDKHSEELTAIMAAGSKSFHMASRMLPSWMLHPTLPLYAFCRYSDDIVDGDIPCDHPIQKLTGMLDAAYSTDNANEKMAELCTGPMAATFPAVCKAFGVPRRYFDLLIEGYQWDRDGKQYETIEQTKDYCVRVASTVGGMMTTLMFAGRENCAPYDDANATELEKVTLARAFDLGIALQLTNICRDIGEDARNNRCYMPRQWMREEGLDPEEFMKNPVMCDKLARVVARMLKVADHYYELADQGVGLLPSSCRLAISSARHIYSEIGVLVKSNGYDSVNARAHTSKTRKLQLVFKAYLGNLLGTAKNSNVPATPETQVLMPR